MKNCYPKYTKTLKTQQYENKTQLKIVLKNLNRQLIKEDMGDK